MNIQRLYQKTTGDFFDAISYEGSEPSYDTVNLINVVPPLNNATRNDQDYKTQAWDGSEWVVTTDYARILADQEATKKGEIKAVKESALQNLEMSYNSVTYQADESSTSAMATKILAMQDQIADSDIQATDTIGWIAKDNSEINVTIEDLKEMITEADKARQAVKNKRQDCLSQLAIAKADAESRLYVIAKDGDFLNQVSVGDNITLNSETREVVEVISKDKLKVNSPFTGTGIATTQTVSGANTTLTGTVSHGGGGVNDKTLMGDGTSFTTELAPYDMITIDADGITKVVMSIQSDTELTLSSGYNILRTGVTAEKVASPVTLTGTIEIDALPDIDFDVQTVWDSLP